MGQEGWDRRDGTGGKEKLEIRMREGYIKENKSN